MSDPERAEQVEQWGPEKKPVPLPQRIKRLKDSCRWLTLTSMMAYLLVNLLRASQQFAQHKTTFMIFENPLPTSQIRALLDFDQAWKVTLCTTVFLAILTLPRWQGVLALVVVFLWEVVIGPVSAI